MLPFSDVIQESAGIPALGKAVQIANVGQLYLLVAAFVSDKQLAPEFGTVEFLTTSQGDGADMDGVAHVAADQRPQVLGAPGYIDGKTINLVIGADFLHRDGFGDGFNNLQDSQPSALFGHHVEPDSRGQRPIVDVDPIERCEVLLRFLKNVPGFLVEGAIWNREHVSI